MSKIKPRKWTEVYPVGTKEGDEESRFFKSLARHPKYEWRSTAALAKESNLSTKRAEEIIAKYFRLNMILQNPKNEEHWGYWERVKDLLPEEYVSVSDADKIKRVDRFLKNKGS
jgi:hypothetical protein